MSWKNNFRGTPKAEPKIVETDCGLMSKYNDNWAEVELFRWQHGELPKSDDTRKLDVCVAAEKMAQACLVGKVNPFNAASAIAYLGKRAGAKP